MVVVKFIISWIKYLFQSFIIKHLIKKLLIDKNKDGKTLFQLMDEETERLYTIFSMEICKYIYKRNYEDAIFLYKWLRNHGVCYKKA